MKKAIITITNPAYVEHTKYMFGAARKTGKWMGDLVLVANGLTEEATNDFVRHGIIVHKIPSENYNWAKIRIFTPKICKQYARLLYLDQDVTFFSNCAPLFESDGVFLSDADSKSIGEEFDKYADPDLYGLLSTDINVNLPAFCAGVMRYDSEIISDYTIERLEHLRDKYRSINRINGIADGMADQPILNIYFGNIWKRLFGECFWGCRDNSTILTHNTAWYGPWLSDRELYQTYLDGIDYFNTRMK